MKRPILILIPVLLLTLVLIYPRNEAPKPTQSAKPVPVRDSRRGGSKVTLKPKTEIPSFSWRAVESADYRQYVANLRSINIPELTVTDIIVADVNRLFIERALKLKADYNESFQSKFWQVASMGTSGGATYLDQNRRLGATLQALNQERVRLINDLLGKEIADPLALQQSDAFKMDAPAPVQSLDFLSEPKQRARNALLQAAFAEMRATIPEGTSADRAMQLRKAIAEKYDAELTKILSPAEKLEYDARFSDLAQNLRANLYGMQPTREEFLQVVALGRRYFEEYEIFSAKRDPQQIPDQLQAKRAVDAQLEQALGTERFQQFQRGTDDGYGRDTRFVTGLGLNQETANELYRLREDLRRGDLLNQPSVLTERNLEAAKSATMSLLGEEVFRKYTTRLEGRWLTGLPNSLAPIISVNVRAVQNR